MFSAGSGANAEWSPKSDGELGPKVAGASDLELMTLHAVSPTRSQVLEVGRSTSSRLPPRRNLPAGWITTSLHLGTTEDLVGGGAAPGGRGA
jgi:hypothetical protein